MEELGIQSKYALPSYKPITTRPNEESAKNLLDREFNVNKTMSVLVSDLTVKKPLETVKVFHTDRGSEFKNVGIDELLNEYNIERSLSDKEILMIMRRPKRHLRY